MTRETLEAKIEKRANEKAQEAIRKFKADIRLASSLLMRGTTNAFVGNSFVSEEESSPLKAYVAGESRWPRVIWTRLQEETEKEVLATMDAVQRMLVSNGGDGEFAPIETEEK